MVEELIFYDCYQYHTVGMEQEMAYGERVCGEAAAEGISCVECILSEGNLCCRLKPSCYFKWLT